MAIGDDATAAGLPVLTGAEDLRDGWIEINRTRDHVAALMLPRRQIDTTNSRVPVIVQHGAGKVAGAASATVSESVFFPVAFASVPIVLISFAGTKAGAGGSWDLAGTGATSAMASAEGPSTAGFTARIRHLSANLSATNDYYYTWIAIGEPA